MKGIEKLLELVFSIITIFRTKSGSLFELSLFKVIYYSFFKAQSLLYFIRVSELFCFFRYGVALLVNLLEMRRIYFFK